MKKFFFLTIYLSCFLLSFSQSLTETPLVWLRADRSELGAVVWRDVSGHAHGATPSLGTLPESYTLFNFNKSFPVHRDLSFHLPDLALPTAAVNAIIVYRVSDSIAEQGLWQLGVDSVSRVGLSTQRILNERGELRYGTSNRMGGIVNSLTQSWGSSAGDTSLRRVHIGALDSLSFEGDIAEFLLFGKRLSDSTLMQWISYLGVKYGITLYHTNYVNSSGQCIWSYDHAPDYTYSVAGIGKDTLMGLHQKQTYFIDQQIIFGLDSLAGDNEHHGSEFREGDFMMMGCDSSGLLVAGTLYLNNGSEFSTYGNCKVQVSGTGNSYATFLQVQAQGWDNDFSSYGLLIDRSGSGTYPLDQVELYLPSQIDSLGFLYFENLQWDPDGNGTDVFCFASFPGDSLSSRSLLSSATGGEPAQETNRFNSPQELNQAANQSNGSSYSVYPNPTSGRFTLSIHYPQVSEVTVHLLSSDGKLVKSLRGDHQTDYRFTDSIETAGHYLLEIRSATEQKTLKMVVY
ncbi:MAG: T9SS type A sorting domain-containing protein [Hydrogenoanaerobacterium sp.]